MTTRTSLKRTNIGHSKSIEALMVRIDWTDAKIVRIEARKDFTMAASTVKVLHDEYTVLADAPVSIKAGQVLYFAASDSFPGWYYVLTYSEARSSFTCTCPKSYHFHKACDHQQHAMAFVGHRYARQASKAEKFQVLFAKYDYRHVMKSVQVGNVTIETTVAHMPNALAHHQWMQDMKEYARSREVASVA